ncbi:hypothetical protein [Kitasatospora sp. NPDC087271]|uniref:hypothetical protein n=1 Tax=Kitasatospora sp. NPDC087271 TaxID=3364067 RepID=UPI00380C83C9
MYARVCAIMAVTASSGERAVRQGTDGHGGHQHGVLDLPLDELLRADRTSDDAPGQSEAGELRHQWGGGLDEAAVAGEHNDVEIGVVAVLEDGH